MGENITPPILSPVEIQVITASWLLSEVIVGGNTCGGKGEDWCNHHASEVWLADRHRGCCAYWALGRWSCKMRIYWRVRGALRGIARHATKWGLVGAKLQGALACTVQLAGAMLAGLRERANDVRLGSKMCWSMLKGSKSSCCTL